MLLIQNGRISAKKVSFSLPEGMYFDFNSSIPAGDRLLFVDKSMTLELSMHILEYKKDYAVEIFLNHESFIPMSELLTLNRGGLVGKGIFYRNRTWNYEFYEEQLDVGDGYIASIRVTCSVNPISRERIRKAMMTSPIKDFFGNIEAT